MGGAICWVANRRLEEHRKYNILIFGLEGSRNGGCFTIAGVAMKFLRKTVKLKVIIMWTYWEEEGGV
jgi:hypothetical protein